MSPAPRNPADRDPILEEEALARLKEVVGSESFDGLLSSFRENLAGYRMQLGANLAGGDPDAARRTAHSLGGLCAQFGAVEASQLATMIENCAQQLEDARAIMIDLEEALDALDLALGAIDQTGPG